jgi:hypothetical protein
MNASPVFRSLSRGRLGSDRFSPHMTSWHWEIYYAAFFEAVRLEILRSNDTRCRFESDPGHIRPGSSMVEQYEDHGTLCRVSRFSGRFSPQNF